ncbi:MAG: cell division protein SepF [Actinomycetaceae bacterium]|nr:cell division protein SepF [Actinomycetaceae bacterium]
MGALKKTMEYMGFRDPAQDELADFDDTSYEDISYPVSEAPLEPVASFPSSRLVNTSSAHGDLRRIVTVCPRTYNEAKPIGDAFRDGTPVIMNLTSMSEGEARRMVDFASGLIYGLNGSIERVTNRVFLLSPETVEVTEGATPTQGNIFNQG